MWIDDLKMTCQRCQTISAFVQQSDGTAFNDQAMVAKQTRQSVKLTPQYSHVLKDEEILHSPKPKYQRLKFRKLAQQRHNYVTKKLYFSGMTVTTINNAPDKNLLLHLDRNTMQYRI